MIPQCDRMKYPRRLLTIGLFTLVIISLLGCNDATLSPGPTATPLPPVASQATIPTSSSPTELPTLTPVPSETAKPMPTTPPTSTAITLPPGNLLFDDFSYTTREAMTGNGWIIRDKTGWPGVAGASWPVENVSFIDDPEQAGNKLLQMISSTDGTAGGTWQTQICQQRKYLDGTYATRVHFSDEPVLGPDGDQVVETFYMISPLIVPRDPDYSEMDTEYVPNGGWSYPEYTFAVTTWETAQIEPWFADNSSDSFQGSMAGWHTIVMQVMDHKVNYLIDGKLIAWHGGKFYPEVPMSINYNLWFVNGGLLDSDEIRQYAELVDWVYFEADEVLTPPEVAERVNALRAANIPFQDTVPAWDPELTSPCDL